MKITWFGHSAFALEANNIKILIDPFFTGNPLCGEIKDFLQPDLILVTHDHGDHIGDTVEILKNGKTQVLAIADICYHLTATGVNSKQVMFGGNGMNIGGTVRFGDFSITMTHAIHSSIHGTPAGFIIQDPSGFTVYHAGDTALFSDMALLAERFSIDLALLPIGGHFTMDAFDAAKACYYLEAKQVIPMHYKTFPVLCQDTVEFKNFIAEFSKTKVIDINPNETIELGK